MKKNEFEIPFYKRYNIVKNKYANVSVTTLPLSIRVINRFMASGITTIQELLESTPSGLLNMQGFGQKCMHEVDIFCSQLDKDYSMINVHKEKTSSCTFSIFVKHRDDIAIGNFYSFNEADLTESEIIKLYQYKEAYALLGKETCLYLH